MKNALLTAALLAASLAASPAAFAQKEAMDVFYQMQLAPSVCGWRDAGSSAKLDATVTAQERGFGIAAAERATMRRDAEAAIRSDASACASDGMLRMMFNAAQQ